MIGSGLNASAALKINSKSKLKNNSSAAAAEVVAETVTQK